MPAGEKASGEEGLLEKCPWCSYSLRGLPTRHACPECGRSFDRRAHIFRNTSNGWRKAQLGFNCFGIVHIVLTTWFSITRPADVPVLAYLCLNAIYVAALVWQFQRRRIFVLVDPDTVSICDARSGQIARYATADLRGAEMDRWQRLVLHHKERSIAIEHFGGMASDVFGCVRRINEVASARS